MSWNDGDFAEELYSVPPDDLSGYYCPWCKKETDIWFDRTITYLPDGTELGMTDRCTECGKATTELPEEKDEDTWEVENDGG